MIFNNLFTKVPPLNSFIRFYPNSWFMIHREFEGVLIYMYIVWGERVKRLRLEVFNEEKNRAVNGPLELSTMLTLIRVYR